MAAFDARTLAEFETELEVDVETWSADRGISRVIIWIVVVDGAPFIRSVRAAAGRWYRELLAEPLGAIHVNGRRVPVRAVPDADPATNRAVDAALAAKYAHDSEMPPMLTPAVVATNLRLEPA